MKYFAIEVDGVEGALSPIENLDKARKDFITFVNLPKEKIKKKEEFERERERIIKGKIRIYKVQKTETTLNLIDEKEIEEND